MFTHDLSFNEDGTEVDGVSLKTVSDRFRMHNLSLAENMFFFSKLENQAALFRAHLYGDGEYRDDSVQIEFALNSKFDGFKESVTEAQLLRVQQKLLCIKEALMSVEQDAFEANVRQLHQLYQAEDRAMSADNFSWVLKTFKQFSKDGKCKLLS